MVQDVARYARNPSFVFRKIVDELILVPIHADVADMDCIYTLNEVAAFLWERLELPATQAELEAAILEDYEVDPQAVAADVESFLQEMLTFGAVRRV